MDNIWEQVLEETAPGANNMDLTWMSSFWEVFTECVIEMDTQFNVKNLRRKSESVFATVDIIDKPFLDFIAEKDKEFAANELEKLKNAIVPYIRFQCLSVLGKYYRWTLSSFYENNVFCGCHGVVVDVTEQTLKEITLNWQRAVLEENHDFVRIFDMEGRILYTNPGAYRMTGYKLPSDVPPSEYIYTHEHFKEVYGNGLETVRKHGFWTGRGELLRSDGEIIPIEHTMFSIKNEQNETILVATIIKDITDFFEHEKKLVEMRQAAEAANIAKSEFLSRMSHEIRTPMNAIIGMISIGMNTDNIDRKDYCFTRADNAAKHLLGLINDILDISKIEADKLELSHSVFDFEKALKNITSIANVRAEEKHLNFIVNLEQDVPSFILCDEMRLSQVITNLLTNAIKFTPEKGTVTLSIEKIEEINDDIVLRIEVADTGIGISNEQQERLFTSFNQADASISQTYGGTGLGLAISKRIIEHMDGEIWIESELGQGSKFIFKIKTKRMEGNSRTKLYEKINLRSIRILAVDDSLDTREYFVHTMEALKLHCDVAADGFEAMRMVEESTNNPYSIFFIDWQMPGMDGIELTQKIKEANGDNAIVIMISANDWTAVEKQAIAVGVNHFIPKPLFPSTLINAINICLGETLQESADDVKNDKSEHNYNFNDYTLLIAEDIEINREIMSAILEGTGAAIEFAENGRIALYMFMMNPEKYSLILMDINMPEMDGYNATRQIRALDLHRAKDIPIIAMTANVFKEDIEKCISSGMDDHTGKPINADELFEKISFYVNKKKGSDA